MVSLQANQPITKRSIANHYLVRSCFRYPIESGYSYEDCVNRDLLFFSLQLYRDWLPFVYSKDALSNGVLPTVAQKAAIFLLLFGLILKLLK